METVENTTVSFFAINLFQKVADKIVKNLDFG